MSEQAPIELYRITCGDDVWRYTSGDKNYTNWDGEYLAVPMGRSSIESKGQVKKENLDVSFDVHNEMARDFLIHTPDRMVYLTVYIVGDQGEYTGWKGRLSATKPNKSQITLVFESIYTSIKSSLLTQSYQRNCRHLIYSEMGCRVKKEDHMLELPVASINGYTLTLAGATGHPSRYYLGGIVEFNGGMRGVLDQIYSVFTLSDQWPSLQKAVAEAAAAGTVVTVKIYPGCDKTTSDCFGKFENLPNFGGFPFIPLKNPFDGSIT